MKYQPICFTVSMIWMSFWLDTAKKNIKSLWGSDDKADQITGQNDDKMFGIPSANLELKHLYSNLFQFDVMINRWMK